MSHDHTYVGIKVRDAESTTPPSAPIPPAPPYTLHPTTQAGHKIAAEVIKIGELLLLKNAKYGNSALEPMRVHSNANIIEQLNVRLDDKLTRMRNMANAQVDDEDTELDYIGYLILRRVAKINLLTLGETNET